MIELSLLPSEPGVYIMKDNAGSIIYVGKAKNLKKRVSSYFHKKDHSLKIKNMVAKVDALEYILTDSEEEAFILENKYIKDNQPRYNTRLKDSKTYPYIKIDLKDKFPTVQKVRQRIDDGALYFGPFVQGKLFNSLLELIKKNFLLRRCRKLKLKEPCLYGHMGSCLAPCSGEVSEQKYSQIISDVIVLLEGRYPELSEVLVSRMKKASSELNFEIAGEIKKQLDSLELLMSDQKIDVFPAKSRIDMFVLSNYLDKYILLSFRIKKGFMYAQYAFEVDSFLVEDKHEIMTSAIIQFYDKYQDYPHEIVFDEYPTDYLKSFLDEKKIKYRQRLSPAQQELLVMLKKNSFFAVKRSLHQKSVIDYGSIALALKESLGAIKLPLSVVGVDISHLGGVNIVASAVYYKEGIPQKNYYRKYNIKSVDFNDDYASMYEVVKRMFGVKRASLRPDLLLIDGGKGQLNASLKALEDLNVKDQEVISLAKKEEIVYSFKHMEGIKLDKSSEQLKFLQMVRDEAHRFAISFQRSKRIKELK